VALTDAGRWPAIPLSEWSDTRDTLHLWTQVVGKVRMAHAPLVNHWWNVPLYVTAHGLTTSLVPYSAGRSFRIDFDLCDHRLDVAGTDGGRRSLPLGPIAVADFHRRLMGLLDGLDLHTSIWPYPVEIADWIPFADDRVHASYDPEWAHRFWLALVEIDRVLHEFRGRFVGKASPVHLFWGALDMAATRFSGRSAPRYPRAAPNCGPFVMEEAYSHEVSSCGYWPGGGEEGAFYSYAYPEPDGFAAAPVGPDGARYDEDLGEFVLPYERVRTAPDPDAALLEFLQSTYEAAADLAGWHRAALERRG